MINYTFIQVAMAFQNTIQAYAAASLDFNQEHPSATFAVYCDDIANGTDFMVRCCVITVLNHQQKISFHHQNAAIVEDILEASEEGDH